MSICNEFGTRILIRTSRFAGDVFFGGCGEFIVVCTDEM